MSRYDRQTDLIKCNMSTPITVIGAGGIGSFTVLTLAKMGFDNIRVFDFDHVEEHNLSNQFYRTSDIGNLKVEALRNIVHDFDGAQLQIQARRVTAEDIKSTRPDVLISAVDNMTTRKLLYDTWHEACLPLFIDGRMGADQIEVYTIPALDERAKKLYEDRLWPDSETAMVPCTSRATMYNVLMIASLIANNVRLALQEMPVRPATIVDNRNVSMYYVKAEEA